jgi:hypothetical protein
MMNWRMAAGDREKKLFNFKRLLDPRLVKQGQDDQFDENHLAKTYAGCSKPQP